MKALFEAYHTTKMALILIKNSLRSFLPFSSRLIHINARDIITQNERDWIADNSKKLLEKVKSN